MAQDSSPPWGPTVKLVVGLTLVAIVAGLLIQFRNIVGPLLLALMLAYMLHPLISLISRKLRIPWRTSVNIIFLLIVVILGYLITISGVAAVQQTQNLVRVVERFIVDLPDIVEDLSSRVFLIGVYEIDMRQFLGQYDLDQLLNQIVEIVQPVLGQAGGLIRSIASRTFTTLGWLLFILLVSYFSMLDAGQFPDMISGLISNIDIPGYRDDFSKLARSLNRIWNAFVRGQLILFIVTVIVAFILLSILGVRNTLALSLVAGFARFVPYIGPFITWLTTGLVAYFQTANYLDLTPLTYALIVLAVIILWDQIIDNLVTPRLYGQALGVHPAAVLVAAIIAANLLGLIGLLFAAPTLATLTLFSRYALRKMFDQDPWPEDENEEPALEIPGTRAVSGAASWIKGKITNRRKGKTDE